MSHLIEEHKKEGFGVLTVGRTGTGKTTLSKKMLSKVAKGKNIIIYDVNGEYKEFYKKPFVGFEEFMESTVNVKNSVILIEEATIFLSVKGTEKQLVDLLVRKRHDNNIIIMNFHSFATIPKYLYNLVNYVTVLKTMDSEKKISEKYDNDQLLEAYKMVKEHPNKFKSKTVNLYG